MFRNVLSINFYYLLGLMLIFFSLIFSINLYLWSKKCAAEFLVSDLAEVVKYSTKPQYREVSIIYKTPNLPFNYTLIICNGTIYVKSNFLFDLKSSPSFLRPGYIQKSSNAKVRRVLFLHKGSILLIKGGWIDKGGTQLTALKGR